MSSYKPPFARMRQIKRDAVRPEREEVPLNVEAALATAPESVFIIEEAEQPAPIAEAAPEVMEPPATEEIPADEQVPEDIETPAEEAVATEDPAKKVDTAPGKVVFSSQKTKKELIAIALAAGWEVPADMSRASILAELTKMNGE